MREAATRAASAPPGSAEAVAAETEVARAEHAVANATRTHAEADHELGVAATCAAAVALARELADTDATRALAADFDGVDDHVQLTWQLDAVDSSTVDGRPRRGTFGWGFSSLGVMDVRDIERRRKRAGASARKRRLTRAVEAVCGGPIDGGDGDRTPATSACGTHHDDYPRLSGSRRVARMERRQASRLQQLAVLQEGLLAADELASFPPMSDAPDNDGAAGVRASDLESYETAATADALAPVERRVAERERKRSDELAARADAHGIERRRSRPGASARKRCLTAKTATAAPATAGLLDAPSSGGSAIDDKHRADAGSALLRWWVALRSAAAWAISCAASRAARCAGAVAGGPTRSAQVILRGVTSCARVLSAKSTARKRPRSRRYLHDSVGRRKVWRANARRKGPRRRRRGLLWRGALRSTAARIASYTASSAQAMSDSAVWCARAVVSGVGWCVQAITGGVASCMRALGVASAVTSGAGVRIRSRAPPRLRPRAQCVSLCGTARRRHWRREATYLLKRQRSDRNQEQAITKSRGSATRCRHAPRPRRAPSTSRPNVLFRLRTRLAARRGDSTEPSR